ncbi:MAG TPA: M23 family metallopeptidase, partial [Deinococcales bacterium]|nr:M23 family metallopeptidase [Deinococcales bacterium]
LADLEKQRAVELAAIEKAREEAEAKRQAELAAAERQRRAELAAAQAEAEARQAAADSARKREQLRVAQRLNVQKVVRVAASYHPPVLPQGGGYAWPLRSFQVTSGYGSREFWIGSSNFHTGVDLAAPTGTPIYAAHTGQVIEAGWGDFGQDVKIAVGDGVVNIYGHMSAVATSPGAQVGRGQLIGYVGCTGICTGPHLHFEVDVNGQPRNPYGYLP